jgi:membrane protease YdiL (CAAX protease family)/predicted RNA-binding Zn-ribbon protein involved in translation (DUF1610 family)
MRQGAEQLVTIATFDLAAQAETPRLLLEQEGIRAFLADDNLVRAIWFLANAVGGTKLQVATADAERARKILEHYQVAKQSSPVGLGKTSVPFACEECGESITFPAERCGHVETCPSCGAYVDVPDDIESPLFTDGKAIASQPIAQEAEPTKVPIPDSRTTSQLWIEVLAVLCLAYVPYLFRAIFSFMRGSGNAPFVYRELSLIVDAIQISAPMLVILALAKIRWSLFGIVRPMWITDAVVGCIIFLGDKLAYRLVLTSLPRSLVESAANLHRAHRVQPQGLPAYFLLLVACIAVGFAEEFVMRGYLIPRLERLLRSTWLAVLVTSGLFASYHLYQGVAPATGIFATGLVYAVSFCLLRRLWPLCVAHALVDFTAYF